MIDKKPAVGRILFRTSPLWGGHFARCGVITRAGDKTVAYVRRKNAKPGMLYTLSVAAVCDTEDEAATLEAFDRRARETISDTIDRFRFEAAVLTNSVRKP